MTASDHEPTRRMTLSQVIERMTEKRPATTSVTIKLSAQGVVMPEVTVSAGASDDEVDTATRQAIRAFTDALAAALPAAAPEPKTKAGAK